MVADPPRAAGRRPHRPAAGGARPARAGAGERRRDHRLRRPTPSIASQRPRWPDSWSSPTWWPALRRWCRCPSAVIDPRPDPTGARVAWVDGHQLWVLELDDPSSTARVLAGEDDPEVRWGVAEFVAAEDMDRYRGLLVGSGRGRAARHPGGRHARAAMVDRRPGAPGPARRPRWPTRPPAPRTPTSPPGSSALDGTRTEVTWEHDDLPYLAEAAWDDHGPLLALHPRDQRRLEVRGADPRSGAYRGVVDRPRRRVGGAGPGHARPPGRWARRGVLGHRRPPPARDRRHAGHAGRPPRAGVSYVGDDRVVFTANPIDDATGTSVWRWTDAGLEQLTADDGVHTATVGGDTIVVRRAVARRATRPRWRWSAVRPSPATVATPLVTPNVTIHHVGERRLATALLLPHDVADDARLPVLVDPYGGPHAQRVVQARSAYLTSQWFADQGFAVVVIDGRGTPGRGAAWERGDPPQPGRPGAGGSGRRPPRPRRRGSAARPDAASPSAGGASAATSPRWRCCAAPTCSTPPSPVRR